MTSTETHEKFTNAQYLHNNIFSSFLKLMLIYNTKHNNYKIEHGPSKKRKKMKNNNNNPTMAMTFVKKKWFCIYFACELSVQLCTLDVHSICGHYSHSHIHYVLLILFTQFTRFTSFYFIHFSVMHTHTPFDRNTIFD